MKKNIGILFSGGVDSTFLIWKNLKEGNVVIPIYISIKNNKEKTILEKNRIKLLWEKFNSEFKNNIKEIIYSSSININETGDGLILKQVPIWIINLIYLSDLKKFDEFQIGYVMNDDAISYINDIKKIYLSYKPLIYENKLVPLKFPLTKTKKEEIFVNLPKEYLDLTVSCEMPFINKKTLKNKKIEYEPCGLCAPCKKRMEININKKYHSKEYINLIANNSIKELFEIKDLNIKLDNIEFKETKKLKFIKIKND